MGFNGAVLRLFRAENDGIHSSVLNRGDHFFATGLGQMVWEETTVADNQPHGHFLSRHKCPRMKVALYRPRSTGRQKLDGVNDTDEKQDGSPPYAGVEAKQHDRIRRW